MRRYWINKTKNKNEIRQIVGDDYHHIINVCRREKGDKFEVIIGDGKAYLVEITEVQKKQAIIQVLEERDLPVMKPPHIHVVLSFPRPQVFSSVLEKLVELGVYKLHPVISTYSHFKSTSHPALQKQTRWQKIVKSASQQSGRADLMPISNVVSLTDFLKNINQNGVNRGLFAYEGESNLSWQSAVKEVVKQAQENIYLFIGSEGGYHTDEVDLFQQAGFEAMSMGEQVLRVETACVALVSSLKYELGK